MIFILIFADGTANSCLRPSVAPPGDKGYNEGAITQDSSKGGNPYAHHKKIPAVLTIAGSDCSGGAGIQADIKTMTMHGVYAMSAITALTAQNTQQVTGILPVPPAFLTEQTSASGIAFCNSLAT
ncbi:hydroxymethylpyrimidine kinase/phosphomethylpyrimidine kinase [Selenomonas ruminantium]|uniref:Hydroxymethylpyrimidine kinase/phosphomethylpyrimidine kinase n=1 Tax=Selenomonas ruminantium TaxID=971 RepID=A0A1I3C392_SELRU|nr:hydroxymethylpyrimidine kinase/phosphomethylpyrimidine kinase [Selenomonas ruminantium]